MCIAFSSLTFSQERKVEVPEIAVKVILGKTVQLENYTITFLSLEEDSRCPKYTECIWAGRARVMVEVSDNEGASERKQLLFGQAMKGEVANDVIISSEEIIIKGIAVTPYPEMNDNPETKKIYALLLKVVK